MNKGLSQQQISLTLCPVLIMDGSRRCFLLSLLALSACKGKQHAKIPKTSPVLALGDSLTAGYGAPAGADYPSQLRQITTWQVQNAGVSGDTSAQAWARLPPLLKSRPQLVLISIGGNDFLRKIPEHETRQNLEHMLVLCQQQHINAVLIAQPKPSVSALFGILNDHPLYQDLAKKHKVPLLSGVWSDILSQPNLKSDAIHANAQGYRLFAKKLADFLMKQGFL